MQMCKKNHVEIVFEHIYNCPLCQLKNHNDIVHDFIESKVLQNELVAFQVKQRDKAQESPTVT